MIIILEGADKTGKSTLAEALIKKFPGILIKITDRPKDASPQQRSKIKKHYFSVLNAMNSMEGFKNIILDRYFPSEMVYSVKRGYDAMGDEDLLKIESIVSRTEHLLVFCNPGKEIIVDRIRKEPDDYVTEEENLLLLGRYQKFYNKTRLNKIQIDTSRPVEHLLKLIYNKIYEHKRHPQSEEFQSRLPLKYAE